MSKERLVLRPQLDMKILPMSNLSEKSQKYLCNCDTTCERYVHIESAGRFCENNARELGLSIIALIDSVDMTRIRKPKRYGVTSWTTSEENFVRDWCNKRRKENNNRLPRGDVMVLASILDKPYSSTRYKIRNMRAEGKL